MINKRKPDKEDFKKYKAGVRMYGSWTLFETIEEAADWCLDGVQSCEGAERDRFTDAYLAFREGWNYVNTDTPTATYSHKGGEI